MNKAIEDVTLEREIDLSQILTAGYVFREYFTSGDREALNDAITILENPNFGSSIPDNDLEKVLSAMKPSERIKLLELLESRLFLPPAISGTTEPRQPKKAVNRKVTLDAHIAKIFAEAVSADSSNEQHGADFDIDVIDTAEPELTPRQASPDTTIQRPSPKRIRSPRNTIEAFRREVWKGIAAATALLALGTTVGFVSQQQKQQPTITSASINYSPETKKPPTIVTPKITHLEYTTPQNQSTPALVTNFYTQPPQTPTSPTSLAPKETPQTHAVVAINVTQGLLNSIKANYGIGNVDLGIIYRLLATASNKADGFRNFIKLLEKANPGQDIFTATNLNIPPDLHQLLQDVKSIDPKKVVGQTREQIQQIQHHQKRIHQNSSASIIDLGNIPSLEKQAQEIIPESTLNLQQESTGSIIDLGNLDRPEQIQQIKELTQDWKLSSDNEKPQPVAKKSFFDKTKDKITGFFKKLFS